MVWILLLPFSLAGAEPVGETYQEKSAFLDEIFSGNTPAVNVLWLTADIQETSRAILGHAYPGLRVRYWRDDDRTVWILEEIGKEQPITVGFVLSDQEIRLVRVLAYRESRGWEVRYPFFTDQFKGTTLNDNHALNKRIDGITGATLSVRALKKLARLALFLNAQAKAPHAD